MRREGGVKSKGGWRWAGTLAWGVSSGERWREWMGAVGAQPGWQMLQAELQSGGTRPGCFCGFVLHRWITVSQQVERVAKLGRQ